MIGVDEAGRGSWAGPLVATASWIDFKDAAGQEKPNVASQEEALETQALALRVLSFDEKTGQQLNQQVALPQNEKKKETKKIALPWRQWCDRLDDLPLGRVEGDKATAVAALHCIHELA